MKIIIIGDGKVGYALAETLSKENNDITIIDKNADSLRKADENLDVLCIKGNGVSTGILLQAGVTDADLLIAATTSDEVNMVCCLTAKKLGAAHTVARIRDPEYANELSQLKSDLDIDMVINPEQTVAAEIFKLLEFSPATKIDTFAQGRVGVIEVKVKPGMKLIGMKLKNINSKISSSILIGAVLRKKKAIIPDGEFEICDGDTIYIIGHVLKVFDFCRKVGLQLKKIDNIMIIGGGRIAYYLAKYLHQIEVKAKIIENDRKRCEELSESLSDTLIIHGDGTDEAVLHSEGLNEMGAFVAVTGIDEENLISALLAKQNGVKKVIAKINRLNYSNLLQNMALDHMVSPKQITADYILRYVRGLQNAMGNPVKTVYRIVQNQIETLEFYINESDTFINIPLKKLQIAQDALVAIIIRKNQIIIPHGNDVIKAKDNVVVFAKGIQLLDLNDIIQSKEA